MRKNAVYWWEEAPLAALERKPVPPTADVVIVGAGYTGLSAAIRLARAGRSVQVFDKQHPGEGASTRNGGITSGNLRPSHAEFVQRFGEERASAILAEAKAAREDLYRFIEEEKIDCDFALSGRFSGASAPAGLRALAREAEMLNRTLGHRGLCGASHAISAPCSALTIYFGGTVRMDIGGLHPGKTPRRHAAISRSPRVRRCTPRPPVTRHSQRWRRTTRSTTGRGTVRARDVIVGGERVYRCRPTAGCADGLFRCAAASSRLHRSRRT